MRSVFGWSLPPGCGRLPGEEPDPHDLQMAHRCSKCGGFLRMKPDQSVPWEDGFDCDGKITSCEVEYSEGEVRILGEDFKGKTFPVHRASCGEEVSTPDAHHAPHHTTYAAGMTNTYVCRQCGHETKISE